MTVTILRGDCRDSDLDNEQPVTLSVHLTLGDIRWARRFVLNEGARPADFDTKPRS